MTRATAVIVIGLLVGHIAAQVPARDQSGPATSGGRISGVVTTDASQPSPLAGAIVTMSGAALARARSVVTDQSGRFAFAGVPAGRVTLSASKPAYLTMTYGARRPERAGTAITVAAGQNISDIALRLPRGAVVTGVVRDERGQPLPDVTVSASRDAAAGQVAVTPPSSVTDDRGMYRIFGLTPGNYLVVAAFRVTGLGGDISAPSTADVDRLLAELQRPVSAVPTSGTSQTSAPLPVKGYAPTFFPGTVTQADAQLVKLASGEERTADFVVMPTTVGSIEGTIRMADGSPLPAVTVPYLMTEGPTLPLALGSQAMLSIRPTATSGRFKYGGVVPGKYTLTARLQPARGQSVPPLWALAELTFAGSDITNVDLALKPGLRFSGKLAFDGSSPVPDLSKLRVSLSSATQRQALMIEMGLLANMGGAAAVNADGTFEVTGLMPGTYTISVATPEAWTLQTAIVNGKDILDAPFEITEAGDISGALLTFSDQHSELSGLLQSATNIPAPEYFVVALPTDPSSWRANSRRIRSTRPATDGRFVLRDLPAGEYFIAALTDVAAEDLNDPAFLAQVAPAAIKVTLARGEKKTQDLRIAR